MSLDVTERAKYLLVPCVVKNKTFFFFLLNIANSGNMHNRKTGWQAGHWHSDQLVPYSKGGKKQKSHENVMVHRKDSGNEFADLSFSLHCVTSSLSTLKQRDACFGPQLPKL